MYASRILAAPRTARGLKRHEQAECEGCVYVAAAGAEDRRRHDDAAIAQKDFAKDRDALARPRQRREHGEIPEQDLEQERQIADQFDIAPGKAGEQPVWREPRNADDETKEGREHD